jgi:hypothetical protein
VVHEKAAGLFTMLKEAAQTMLMPTGKKRCVLLDSFDTVYVEGTSSVASSIAICFAITNSPARRNTKQ